MNWTMLIGLIPLIIFCITYIYIRWRSKCITNDDSSKLSDYSTVLQNITIICSICIAGIWVLYSFNALKQRENAEIAYEQLKEKINNTESTEISITHEIVPYQSSISEDKTMGLIVNITIANKGISRMDFDFANSPVVIYKVESVQDKVGYSSELKPKLIKKPQELGTTESPINIDTWASKINSKRTLSFFVTVEPDSLYYIVFSVPATIEQRNDNESEQSDELVEKCNKDGKCNWFASKYVFIEKENTDDKRKKKVK